MASHHLWVFRFHYEDASSSVLQRSSSIPRVRCHIICDDFGEALGAEI